MTNFARHGPHLWLVGKTSCPLLFKCITFASVHTRFQLCSIDNSIASIRRAWWNCIRSPMWQYKELKQSLHTSWGFREAEAPRFQYNRHMKVVRLSAVCTGYLYHQEIFLILISVWGWIIVRPKGLCQWRILMKPQEIDLPSCDAVPQPSALPPPTPPRLNGKGGRK